MKSSNPAAGVTPLPICPIGSSVMVVTVVEDGVLVSYGHVLGMTQGHTIGIKEQLLYYFVDFTEGAELGLSDWVGEDELVVLNLTADVRAA